MKAALAEDRRTDGGEAGSPVSVGEMLERARRVVRMEAEAVAALEGRIGASFAGAVEAILASRGRVVVSGVGKSGIVGRKVAATLTSTGTPAFFLHPVEALHGDLGIVDPGDVAILLSKSGESEELRGLLEYLERMGVRVVAMTGRPGSSLARGAEFVLDCSVAEEACPHDLAPTSSTTAAVAMGDALAVALLLRRGFGRDDFARFHPAGSLGRRLLLRVREVMLTDALPLLPPDATMRQAVVLLAERRGTVAVADGEGRLLGVVTSGDLTRLMEREEHFFGIAVSEVMTRDPRYAEPDDLAAAAVGQMERHGIMAMPVLDEARRVVGMVHLHDLMRAGAV
ncbi:MAG TPA: KpsF/GutQ family sugar-phosphate isomerase [Longimicrobiaceae bacterium]|nr:KpsF/GutQ family sugar-phosphate isomerase [Longimicrobiaceae bacterium]